MLCLSCRKAARQWIFPPDCPGSGSPRDHQEGSYQTWRRGCTNNAPCRYCNTHEISQGLKYTLLQDTFRLAGTLQQHPPNSHNLWWQVHHEYKYTLISYNINTESWSEKIGHRATVQSSGIFMNERSKGFAAKIITVERLSMFFT